MAMTKKEKEQVDQLMGELRIMGALRWTFPVRPTVFVGDDEPVLTKKPGYMISLWNREVVRGWTGRVSHGYGDLPDESVRSYTASQGGRKLYATELEALRALRHEVELQSAKNLADVDARIAMAMDAEGGANG